MRSTIGGYIVSIYDPHAVPDVELAKDELKRYRASSLAEVDRRWGLFRRPAVMVGGELTLEALDLRFDPIAKYYEAPLQLKANGGMFLIDDFGRQMMSPSELLNRWIVPLEFRRRLPAAAHRPDAPGALPPVDRVQHQPRSRTTWSTTPSCAASR